jgi:signal transduction histidine kinase
VRVRLREKLTLAYLVPVLALAVVTGVLAFRAAHGALEDELGQRLAGIARTVAGHFTITREGGRLLRLDLDPESTVRTRLDEWLEGLQAATDVRRIFVFRMGEGAEGPVALLDSDPTVAPGTVLYDLEPDRRALEELLAGRVETAHSTLFAAADGSRYMNGYAAIRVEGETAGIVGVAGSAAYFGTLDGFRTALLAMGLMIVGLVIVISVAVSHRLTRPMARLVEAIRRFGRGELKEPVEVRTRDEIGFLAEAFNDMRVRLERRDEQMQLMLSGIAHEVRNPLAGMELFCGLLRGELEEEPEKAELVERIERELHYLARVVNDFLRYARRRPLSPERFAAEALLAEVLDGVGGMAAQRGVTLEVAGAKDVELTGEREALRGVLANLVQNALQACRQGGRVTVTVRAEGARRTLEVADTGKGIAVEEQKKIFEPFYTTREQGTGLGLALVLKTVREHGGDIAVHSRVGEGSRFTVSLPFDEKLAPLVHQPEYEGSGDDIEMIG